MRIHPTNNTINPAHTPNILVVDDDPDILTILEDNLRLDGYRVHTALRGEHALQLLDKNAMDLVVLDLMLPDMDGFQICRTIRSRSNIPIIMLTAKDGLSDKVMGLETGADDYVVKPFDYLELAARIRVCLRRSLLRETENGVMAIADLRLDTATRELYVGDKAVPITKKEFEILSLLFRNMGKALDRDAIRREVWPNETLYKWSRTIDVHIQHLRAKVEENPDKPRYIVTVQGVGYMLSDPEKRNTAP